MPEELLYGIHDKEGRHIVPPGGWVVDTVALSENPRPQSYDALREDVNWLVRLNWGYGTTGTIPRTDNIDKYVTAASLYAIQSSPVYGYIIGNEPNHEQERPDGVYISPEQYADCFIQTRRKIKNIEPKTRVILAAPAPYHANPLNWLQYMRKVYGIVNENGGADGIAAHAYVRGSSPELIHSQEKMGPPLEGQFNGFYTFVDLLAVVPTNMRSLPVFITEFNELLPDGWDNRNTGVVQEAYGVVNDWNQKPSNPKIKTLCLYRWPKFDKWGIEGKHGVIDDFRAATQNSFRSPNAGQEGPLTPIQSQSSTPPKTSPSTAQKLTFQREIDPRVLARGVNLVEINEPTSKSVWKIKKIEWLDEEQSQGRHHFYFDTIDENGKRVAGVPILVSWPTGNTTVYSEEKPGERYSANYPMSPSRNEFTAIVMDGINLSEMVRGVGMGADTPSGFNAGTHTSTFTVFQRVPPSAVQPVPGGSSGGTDVGGGNVVGGGTGGGRVSVPSLVHPVKNSAFRRITQIYGIGVNEDKYKHFKVDGVPLRGHNGVDFGTPTGSAIVAVDAGTVVEAANDPDGYGLYIKIVHTWGETVYAHLSRLLPNVGTNVVQNAVIGYSGNTGNSTGPHLHFGMRIRPFNRADGMGGYIDPLPYLPSQSMNPPLNGAKDPTEQEIVQLIKGASAEFDIDWRLVLPLAYAESNLRPRAVSPVGASGIMQLMPETWNEWSAKVGAKDVFNAKDNIRTGTAYLKWLLDYFDSSYRAVAAYNFGIGNVDRGVEIPEETKQYCSKILSTYAVLQLVA